MTTILSTPASVSVQAVGTSPLAVLAASMSAGTWAQLSVPNQNAGLSDDGASGSILHFCNSMPWNPVSRVIEIVAGDHKGATPGMRHVRYVESSNSFVEAQSAPIDPNIGHGYDHVTVNPYNGDLYYRKYSHPDIMRKAFGASSFSKLTNKPDRGFNGDADGTCWWSGSFSGGSGAGAQGAYMVFNTYYQTVGGGPNDGQVVAYNPLTNSWFFDQVSMSPQHGSTYHAVMEYSSQFNCAVFGGGNDNPKDVWRLNSNGSSTHMPSIPGNARLGMQNGVLCADPVTGKFVVLSARELWELNPSGNGTWTQLTGSRTPPSGVGDPRAPDGVICCSIPNYGVIALITQTSATGGTFYLYKHA